MAKTLYGLDIGSNQITCIAGSVRSDGIVEVQTISAQASYGIEKGTITDMEQATASVKKAIQMTEKSLGQPIHNMTVSFSGLHATSHWVEKEISISGKKIKEIEFKHILNQCKRDIPQETPIIHIIPYFYAVDGVQVKYPVGMFGKKLKASIHIVTTPKSSLENLKILLDRCSVEIDNIVIDSYASALGIMDSEEKNISCMVLDMGGGTTSWSIFYQGNFMYSDNIILGGDHITEDIMYHLSTGNAEAERIKNSHGMAFVPTGNLGNVEYYRIGENSNTPYTTQKEDVIKIIQHRLTNIFSTVNNKLGKFSFAKRLILTGGCSNIKNIRELATHKLQRNVRIAKPIQTLGLHKYDSPSFSTAVGLLRYASTPRTKEENIIVVKPETYEGPWWSRIYNWLKNEI